LGFASDAVTRARSKSRAERFVSVR
jgi:hypothetical protein